MQAVGYAGVPGLEFYAGEGAVGEEEGVEGVFLDAVVGEWREELARIVSWGFLAGEKGGGGREWGRGKEWVRLVVEGFGSFVVAGLEEPGGEVVRVGWIGG